MDVSADLDFTAAAEGDDLEQTVDYERVYGLIRDLVLGESYYLIERLALLIAHAVLEAFPKVDRVEVTVRKVNPPVGGATDRAEAVYRAGQVVS